MQTIRKDAPIARFFGQRLPLIGTLTLWLLATSVARAIPASDTAAKKASTNAVLQVTIRESAEVSARDVTIADIATVGGGTVELREWIGQLDLADPPGKGETIRLTRSQVAFRVRLAGLDDRLFSVDGAREVRVKLASHEVPEREILAAAEQFVRARLPWDEDDIVIQPTQSLVSRIVVPAAASAVRLEASLRSQRMPVGRVRIDITVWANGKKHQEVPVFLEVHVYQVVAVAKRRIDRGQLLTDENVHFDRRAIDDLVDFVTAKDSPLGQRAKRSIAAAQMLSGADIEPQDAQKQVLVKPGDVVKLVARVGDLQLTATGEAIQEGTAGKTIRVRNSDSKLIVTGRVVDRYTVEVLR